MERRRLLVAGAALALAPRAGAQAPPRVGFLRSTAAGPFQFLVTAFREGLAGAGYVEGRNVSIAYRWADNDLSRLPKLASELVSGGVAVIIANSQAAEAARRVSGSTPIVFVTSDDPVQRGFVASLSRPGGNLTGVTFFGGGQLGGKRLELLRELVPSARVFAFLLDARSPFGEIELADAEAAARANGVSVLAFRVRNDDDLASAFAAIAKSGAGAVIVGGSPVFTEQRHRIAQLAVERKLPAMSDQRDFVLAGGLASYAASFTEAYRQAGVYAGKILGGAKPSELPVVQPAKFEFVVNLGTARVLGLTVPQTILLRADETVP